MTAVFDTNRMTRTTHTVEIHVAGAPMLPTHSYYDRDLTYQPDLVVVGWDEGEAPTGIGVVGNTTNGTRWKSGFGLKQAPGWMRDAVIESIEEAKTWDWFEEGKTH